MSKKSQPVLADLYRVKERVTFGEGDEAITVWVVKLNQLDMQSVFRRAQAAKAKVLVQIQDPESDLYQSVLAQVLQTEDQNVLIESIILPEIAEKTLSIQFELEAEKPWGDDEYLVGLRAAWVGSEDEPGLEQRWLDTVDTDDPDPEADRVFKELSKFNDLVSERLKEEHDGLVASYADLDIAWLRDKAVKAFLKTYADQAFTDEYVRQRTFFSVRQGDNWRKPYFAELDDLDQCDDLMVKPRLVQAYEMMTADGPEGKDSPGIPGSSPSSEPLDEEEPSTGSDLVGASPSRTSPTSS